MAYTTLSNMQIVPEKFSKYVLERSTKKNALVRSGVATGNQVISTLINGQPEGGNMLSIPFFKPLTGADEVFSENPMTPSGITTGNQTATLLIRQKAWGATDLASVKGGADVVGAIQNLIGDWWAEREQAIALSVLKGIFDGNTAALKSHVLDVSAEEGTDAIIGVDNTLDAKQLMGDAADKLGVVFMHSATYTQLQKQQKIETEYDSDLKVKINTYLGYQVIVDDDMPVDTGVYDTYFVGRGAFAREDGMPAHLVGTEKGREPLSSRDYLINRRAFILHPNGLSFNPNGITGEYASNADLANPANWTLATGDAKNVPIVCLRHKIA